MKSKFIYFILMIFTVYIEIMYDNSQALLFLSFELLLLSAMFLLSFGLQKKLRISVRPAVPVVSKGQPILLNVILENRGILPISRIRGRLVFKNEYSCDDGEERMFCGLDAKKKVVLERVIPACYCGRICIHLESLRVQDYLGLFARKVQAAEKSYVNVLPDIYPMLVEVSLTTRNFPVDGEEYDPHRSGDDPSEIFQIRAYRQGDSLQRVHWKMSAKAGELMTKEYGLPVGCSILLLADLRHEEKQVIDASKMDRILETVCSISYSLMEEGCIHYAAWFEEDGKNVRRVYVKEEEQVYEMIDLLLGAFPYTEAYDLEEGYHAKFPEGRYAVELRLDSELLLWKNGEIYADFSQGDLKEILPQTLLKI